MILFLYGEDTYRSYQKLNDIKKKYIDASLGDTNLVTLEGSEVSYEELVRQVQAMPFLAKSRLVVIKNLLSKGKKNLQEKILEYMSKVPFSTNLIFYENEKFDKRNALYKKLSKKGGIKKSQEFKLLSDYELRDWIKKEVAGRDTTIEPEAVDKLIQYVGNDLWRMGNEIQKLMAYSLSLMVQNDMQYAISTKQVELLVRPKITANVFDLVDGLGQKNLKRAQQELHKLLNTGEHELYILTMIVYQFRNLLIVKDLLDRKTPILQIKNKSGLHPFVIQKTSQQCKNFTLDQLKVIYQKLLDYDIKLKTGKINPKLALDILVVELCKNV